MRIYKICGSGRGKLKRICFLIILLFLGYQLIYSWQTYISLFDVRTYLPKTVLPVQFLSEPRKLYQNDPGSKPPHIYCLITTSPENHQNKAVHVWATWARHCDNLVFVTSQKSGLKLPTFIVEGKHSYYDLWEKVTRAIEWVYETQKNYDWVLKADDDTFVFVENLRQALKNFTSDERVVFGRQLYTWDTNEIYLNGGAGYVLSKSAVKDLVTKGLKNKSCKSNLHLGTAEDVNMASCLTYLGISLNDLYDDEGKSRFHIYPASEQIDPREEYSWKHLWLRLKSVDPYSFGLMKMTRRPISFHYVDAESMYLIYYLSYIVQI